MSSLSFDENLFPSSQFPLSAMDSKFFPLFPRPLDAEVQNGITILPLKSLALTKVFTGQAAIPHQIGYPIIIVS